jgi:hypothetical protein
VGCFAQEYTFYDTFLTTISYPIGLLLLLLAITCIRTGGAADEAEADDIATQGWKAVLFGMFLVYPSVSSTVLKVWHCAVIEDRAYMSSDYRLQCWGPDGTDAKWAAYASVAGVAFVIYPLGIPLFYFYLLKSNEAALYDEAHPDHHRVEAKLSFLYRAYEEQAYYW